MKSYTLNDVQARIQEHVDASFFHGFLSKEILQRIHTMDVKVGEIAHQVNAEHYGGGGGGGGVGGGGMGKRDYTSVGGRGEGRGGDGRGEGAFRPRDRASARKSNQQRMANEWNALKTTKGGGGVVLSKEGIEKSINDVRVALNKISNKNYDTLQGTIRDTVKELYESPEELSRIAQVIFDIASTNKFYVEVYADLYKSLVEDNGVFLDILNQLVASFKQTIETIMYVDVNENYDKYCEYIKSNEKRRATTAFLVTLMTRSVVAKATVMDIVMFFQTTITEFMEEERRVNDVDEITELVFILLTLGKSTLNVDAAWKDQVMPFVEKMTQFKLKEKPGLSSRSLFKYKDMAKLLQAQSTR